MHDLKVEDIPLENINDEFQFISWQTSIYDIEQLFSVRGKEHKRLGAVFMTEKGKKNEPIVGIITAMDIPQLTDHFIF